MNAPTFKNEPSSTKRETKPLSDIVGLEKAEPHTAKSSSGTMENSHDELKSPGQTHNPANEPLPGAETNAFASAASAADRDSRHAADKGTRTVKRRRPNEAAVATEPPDIPLRKLIPPERLQTGSSPPATAPQDAARVRRDWSAVIARARSHPHEASAPYFGTHVASTASPPLAMEESILAYKPLHAMLKYNPPLDAVEAVLRANPEAALDVTFDGSALKIAAENGVGSVPVLRLLLVAEMAMRKRSLLQRHPGSKRSPTDLLDPGSGTFCGHNPIRWIAERRIPARTAAVLLKWYPAGAFQCTLGGDGTPEDDTVLESDESESPLIEIVDDFSRDHYDQAGGGDSDEGYGAAADDDDRWEKFLHILYSTDLALQGPSSPTTSTSPDTTLFRPVHAWIRCLASPRLGLERCRPYGVWSILRVMAHRIPSEFAARDAANGDRTVFQTLAESPAGGCRLCPDEVRDVVECLIDADYRSAFLPRQSDGRLIGHVALENGWPCKDLFSRKVSATCA